MIDAEIVADDDLPPPSFGRAETMTLLGLSLTSNGVDEFVRRARQAGIAVTDAHVDAWLTIGDDT